MRKIILCVGLLVLCGPALARTAYVHKDQSGYPSGRSETRDGTTTHYDRSGYPEGRTEKKGTTFQNYDSTGYPTTRTEKRGSGRGR